MAFSEILSRGFSMIQNKSSSQIIEKNICNSDGEVTQFKMTKTELLNLL